MTENTPETPTPDPAPAPEATPPPPPTEGPGAPDRPVPDYSPTPPKGAPGSGRWAVWDGALERYVTAPSTDKPTKAQAAKAAKAPHVIEV